MNSFKKNNFYLNYLISFNSRQNNKNYAELIHDNFIKNYTSYNSLYLLDEIYLKCNNSKLLKIDKENFKNVLIRFFYNKKRKTETFISFFKEFVNRTVDKNNQLNYNIIKLLNEFVIVIKNNKDVFIEIENTTESFYYLELMEEEDRISDLIEEYKTVRLASIHLFKSFSDKMLLNIGQANNAPASVRAIGYIITGHEIHHINIIKARYSLF